MIEIISTKISEVKKIIRKRFEDERGFFWEPYNEKAFREAGFPQIFVQDNHSFSLKKGTVRGLHYQIFPEAQDKLLWVLKGSILDVAVDIRKNSPTFGKHVSLTLRANRPEQIFIPAGFAHGFCTLESDTHVYYKITRFYSPSHERGIAWNDKDLGVSWPCSEKEAFLSERDLRWPSLAKVRDLF